MLALNAGRLPLVNPAAFHYGGGALWMTTSRHAAKFTLARGEPRAAFLVTTPGRAAVLRGRLEAFDPLNLRSDLRALREGPGFALNLAGYTMKNAGYVGGYLIDLLRIPMAWWPQNRVLLRLRVERVLRPDAAPVPGQTLPVRLPSVPAATGRALERKPAGYLCWTEGGGPALTPALWAVDGEDPVAWAPTPGVLPDEEPSGGALVVERHHPIRPTRVTGVTLRGGLRSDPSALDALVARFGPGPFSGEGSLVRLEVERVTRWQGFSVHTESVARRPQAIVS